MKNAMTVVTMILAGLVFGDQAQAQSEARSAKSSNKSRSIEEELKLRAGDEQGNEMKALKTGMLVMR